MSAGMTAVLADLDDIAFAQRASVGLAEFWGRAGIAHSMLVRGWFETAVDVVIAHGPFFESRSYDSLFAAAPTDTLRHHVVLTVSFEVALERVMSDPERGPAALSVQPDFLRATHERFAALVGSLPFVDVVIDTSHMEPREVAERVFQGLSAE
jgi:hypothetical protein